MQEIVAYLELNWTWLLPVVLSVVESFFIVILKRKPKYYGYYMDICEAISIAEKMFVGPDRGKEKLQFVIKEVCSRHDMDPKTWGSTIAFQVEKILSLPKKKGGQ